MTNVSSGVYPNSQAGGVTNFAVGYYTGDGTAGDIPVALGFTPRYVKLMDITLGLYYEWIEGLPATDTLLNTGSTGVVTVDTNSVILTNGMSITVTEMAVGVPGAQGAGEGTTGTVSIIEEYAAHTVQNLIFRAGTSGARANAAASLYYWMAFG
jgi:hypothetical protein